MPDAEKDINFLKRKEQRLLAELSRVRAKLGALEEGSEDVSQPEEPCKECPDDVEPTVEEETTESPTTEKKKSKRKKDKKDGD